MWTLYLFALSLAPAHVDFQNVPGLLSDVIEVVDAEEENLFPGDEFGKFKTVKVLYTMAGFESAGLKDALGDGGNACGVTQVHKHAWQGFSCDDIRRDRKLGLRLGLEYIILLQHHFKGNLRLALQAYARGNNYKSKEAVSLVKKRCAIAGC